MWTLLLASVVIFWFFSLSNIVWAPRLWWGCVIHIIHYRLPRVIGYVPEVVRIHRVQARTKQIIISFAFYTRIVVYDGKTMTSIVPTEAVAAAAAGEELHIKEMDGTCYFNDTARVERSLRRRK